MRCVPAAERRRTGRRRYTGADAIQAAFRGATEVPLDVMRACQAGLVNAIDGRARRAIRAAGSDVAVAIELLTAATRAAALNVRVNLTSIRETGYVDGVRAEVERLEGSAAVLAADGTRHSFSRLTERQNRDVDREIPPALIARKQFEVSDVSTVDVDSTVTASHCQMVRLNAGHQASLPARGSACEVRRASRVPKTAPAAESSPGTDSASSTAEPTRYTAFRISTTTISLISVFIAASLEADLKVRPTCGSQATCGSPDLVKGGPSGPPFTGSDAGAVPNACA